MKYLFKVKTNLSKKETDGFQWKKELLFALHHCLEKFFNDPFLQVKNFPTRNCSECKIMLYNSLDENFQLDRRMLKKTLFA